MLGVYRSRSADPLSARLIDAGIGTVLGMLIALCLWATTVAVVMG